MFALPGFALIYFGTRPQRSWIIAVLTWELFLGFHPSFSSAEVLFLALPVGSLGVPGLLALAAKALGAENPPNGHFIPFCVVVLLSSP
jgi:hypothetical protein